VAHTCNPSHSGGRDQEEHWANSSQDPILKNPFAKKKGLVEWFEV
jgi:hypothetical protein